MKLIDSVIMTGILITIAQPAFAYLDPGAGSFMLQMLIAGVMSAMFAIKMYWYRLKAFVARLLGRPVEAPEEDTDDPETIEKQDKSAAKEKE